MKYFLLLLSSLLLSSCGVHDDGSDYKSFHYSLHGVWERVPSQLRDSLDAQIIIDYNSITISNHVHHFEGIPKGLKLEGYSEPADSLIYVIARGELQLPVSYRLWEVGSSYPRTKMMTLRSINLGSEDFILVND